MNSKNFTISPTLSLFLNIFRVFSAWSVLFGHCFTGFEKSIFKNQLFFPFIQNIGVVLLFLLSGFLSAYSFYRKKNDSSYDFVTYLIEKSCRIGIGLLPALIFVAILDGIIISISPEKYIYLPNYNFKTFIGNLLNLQNFFTIPDGDIFAFLSQLKIAPFGTARPLWTLSVEWWIFMAIGYVVLEIIPASKEKNVTYKQLLIMFFVCWQPAEFLFGIRSANLVFIWFLGYFIFYVFHEITQNQREQASKTLPLLFYTIFSIVLLLFLGHTLKDAYSFLFVLGAGNFFLSSILLTSGIAIIPKERIKTFFAKLASYTYPLFLIHYSIMLFVHWRFPNLNRTEKFWLTIFASNLFSILLYYGFDRFGKRISNYLIMKYRSTQP